MHSRTLALVMISSLATVGVSPAIASQSQDDATAAVGYVVNVDGDRLVLSNVPTVAPGRVFKLGGGSMFIAEPEGAEGAAEPAEGEMRMFVRRDGEAAPATPEEAAAAEKAAQLAAEDTEAGADGKKEEPRRRMVMRSDDPEGAADAAKEKETEGEGHVMVAGSGDSAAGGMWMTDDAGGEELAVTDTPLELQELRLGADVPGRDYLIPGLQVRVHFEGEGDERVVSRVELIAPEEPQQ